jgi:hypothetical protein
MLRPERQPKDLIDAGGWTDGPHSLSTLTCATAHEARGPSSTCTAAIPRVFATRDASRLTRDFAGCTPFLHPLSHLSVFPSLNGAHPSILSIPGAAPAPLALCPTRKASPSSAPHALPLQIPGGHTNLHVSCIAPTMAPLSAGPRAHRRGRPPQTTAQHRL